MGSNPPKRDAWPLPRTTRHVWYRRRGTPDVFLPAQALVLEWRLQGTHWRALVAFVDTVGPDRATVQRWAHEDELCPVWSDPNDFTAHRRR